MSVSQSIRTNTSLSTKKSVNSQHCPKGELIDVSIDVTRFTY